MMAGVGLNATNLNARVADLKQASENIEVQTLSPVDEISTPTAVGNARTAFEGAQNTHQVLGAALLESSQVIKDVGDRFFAIDESAATTWEAV